VEQSHRIPAPIVPLAAAFLAGAAWGGVRPSSGAALAGFAIAVLVARLVRRRPAALLVSLVAAAITLGATLQAIAWNEAAHRLDATFRGSDQIDLEFNARVLAAPERTREGGRVLAVVSSSDRGRPTLRLRLDIVDVPFDDVDRIDALRRNDTVRIWSRLRAPAPGPGRSVEDSQRGLAAQRFDATGRVKSSRLVSLVTLGEGSPLRVFDALHVAARGALDRAVGTTGESRAVLGAMLLGDRLLLSDETNVLLRDAGLVHILSISGLHTAITVLCVLALLRRAGLGARGVACTGLALLFAFSAFVGDGASVWRACASLAVGLLARLLSREVDPLAALALAVVVLVIAVPTLAFNSGFLLSVVATAGLLAFRPRETSTVRKPSVPARMIAATSGAYLASAPLIATLFARLAPAAFVSNLAAAPLCAACLATGAAAVVTSPVPWLGAFSAQIAQISVRALLVTSGWAANIPGGHMRVPPPAPGLAAAYVALLLAGIYAAESWSRGTLRTVRLLFALTAIALHVGPTPPGRGRACAEVLDVGQGLAVVLRGTNGGFLLVDAGPSGGGRFDTGDRIVVPRLVAQGCRRLEVLALSHDHDDHAGGALAVLRDVEVGELWVGAGSERDPLTWLVTAEAIARGVAVRRLKRGERAIRAGIQLDILHPALDDRTRPLNDRCLAIRARTELGASILLPGDLERDGEASLLAGGEDPRAVALVAPHHGADGSSTPGFLAGVAPTLVLVSAGRGNRFGHPGHKALARFADMNARVLRTDRDGTISLEAIGRDWRPSVEKDRGGDERENEDQAEHDGDHESSDSQGFGFFDEPRMPTTEQKQDDQPQTVGRGGPMHDDLRHDERRECTDRQPRDPAMRLRRDRE
jgi:DNA internalization-related competence protein ComEC/Rec2